MVLGDEGVSPTALLFGWLSQSRPLGHQAHGWGRGTPPATRPLKLSVRPLAAPPGYRGHRIPAATTATHSQRHRPPTP